MRDAVRVEDGDNGIRVVLLDRAEKRNALSPPMIQALRDVVARSADDGTRVLAIRSATPGMFSAGFDLGVLAAARDQGGDPAESLYDLYDELEACPVVTVAFADGMVRGGGVELFASCDLRLCTESATFAVPAARLSQVYTISGIRRYIRRAGVAATAELLLGGMTLTAADGRCGGLVTRIVGDDDVDDYLRAVALGSPLAQRAMKPMVNLTAEPSADVVAAYLETATHVHSSADRTEALAAWSERRPPSFHGH